MSTEDKLSVPSVASPSGKQPKDISELKKQRGNLKGRLTQFKKYLDSLPCNSISQVQVKEVKFRMQAAQDHFNTFNNIQNQIELILPESEYTANFEYVESFESLYFNVLATAESIVENTVESLKCNSKSSVQSNVKLPDIKLPSFDGSFDQWLEYRNSYITMIHNRSDLDEIQKFHYLKASLSGCALQVISALEFTASNYVHPWDLLHSRFHNTRLLIQNHLKSLFSISPLKQESHLQIRRLIDTTLRNLRALKSLNEPTEHWDTIIINLVVSKLDASTEREWENCKGSILTDSNKRLQLDDLLSFLKNKSNTLEMISSNKNKLPQCKPHIISENKHYQSQGHVIGHTYTSTNYNKNNNSKKAFSYNKRNSPENNSCVLCNGHSATECMFGPCKQCRNKHNTLLHVINNLNKFEYTQSGRSADFTETREAAGPSTALHSVSTCSALPRNAL
ncbi:unnamed protein product [Euphydryas editha]|uniref:Gag protein n=1 Tax=Euphydryas editha TaxID=104508 RepID=A0AAU9UE15_EUPED|nr:unnamed protein product [Euphydryas editha]